MGGAGVSNDRALLKTRLDEEVKVREINEDRILWIMAQMVFRFLYVPYKTTLVSKFQVKRVAIAEQKDRQPHGMG